MKDYLWMIIFDQNLDIILSKATIYFAARQLIKFASKIKNISIQDFKFKLKENDLKCTGNFKNNKNLELHGKITHGFSLCVICWIWI